MSTADWLEERVGRPGVRIIEASISKDDYDHAHIPGALWVDHFADLLRNGDESSGLVITPEQYAALMGRLGVAPETTVVWYGDRHSSYAIRGFWTMDYYQHPGACHVLEGGRERWIAEGRPTTSEPTPVTAATYPVPPHRTLASQASWQEVQAAIGAPDRVVLDVRSLEEYDGHGRASRSRRTYPRCRTHRVDGSNRRATTSSRTRTTSARCTSRTGVTPDKESSRIASSAFGRRTRGSCSSTCLAIPT